MIDLHTHSTASDGTDSPADLVRAGAAAGLTTMAITDHDSTLGWDAAATSAAASGVALVRGAELSTRHRGISVHLLGYLFDPEHPGLASEMTLVREDRLPRLAGIVQRFVDDGFDLTWEDVEAQIEPGASAGRPHVADALVAKGYAAHRNDVFARWLHSGSRYYLPQRATSTAEAVSLVRAAGGVPVLAHPFAVARGRTIDADDVAELVDAGLLGIEVDHRDHDDTHRALAARLAEQLELIPTGSSDYHGTGKHNQLGERTTPAESLARIEELASGVTVLR